MQQYALSARSPLSVIVPTLNEQDNVKRLVERIHDALHRERITYEILFVDDHSTDHTVRNLESLADIYPDLRVLQKEGERGKAFSLIQGFGAAQYKLVCMIDADLQYPPEAIVPMYNKLEKESADIVVTERVGHKTSWVRRLSTRVFNLVFTRLLFGINLDSQSGLKLFKKRVLGTIDISPSPWSFDLEFIIRALEQDYKITNHKISFAQRTTGEAKLNLFTATCELMKASIVLSRHSSRKKVRQAYAPMTPVRQGMRVSKGFMLLMAITLCLAIAAVPVHAAALSVPGTLSEVSAELGVPRAVSGLQAALQPKSAAPAAAPASRSQKNTAPAQSAPAPAPAPASGVTSQQPAQPAPPASSQTAAANTNAVAANDTGSALNGTGTNLISQLAAPPAGASPYKDKSLAGRYDTYAGFGTSAAVLGAVAATILLLGSKLLPRNLVLSKYTGINE